jgi:hypothetical protein
MTTNNEDSGKAERQWWRDNKDRVLQVACALLPIWEFNVQEIISGAERVVREIERRGTEPKLPPKEG